MTLPLLLLTRPRAQSERLAADWHAALPPHEVLIAPLTEIAPVPFDPAALADADALVLTSANAVAALAGVPGQAGRLAWCVGSATAAAARAAGFEVHVSGGDAESLLADLRAARPRGRLVHVRGRHVARDLAATLGPEGIEVAEVVAYEARGLAWPATVRPALAARRVVAPLFSPRAAGKLAERLGTDVPAGLRLVAISANCAARLPEVLKKRTRIATSPDSMALRSIVAELLSQAGPEP